jgi:hypothetical protein
LENFPSLRCSASNFFLFIREPYIPHVAKAIPHRKTRVRPKIAPLAASEKDHKRPAKTSADALCGWGKTPRRGGQPLRRLPEAARRAR